jgi:hypothetical protein
MEEEVSSEEMEEATPEEEGALRAANRWRRLLQRWMRS